MRHRLVILIVAVLTATGVGACGKDDEDAPVAAPPGAAPAAPMASAGAGVGDAAGASPSADAGQPEATGKFKPEPGATGDVPGVRMTAFGIGPYEVGVSATELRKVKLVGKVFTSNGCGTGAGTAKYRGPRLTFAQGKLQRILVDDKKVATATGARIGTSAADLEKMYPKGKTLSDWVGANGWMVTEGANALLFKLKDDKVTAMVAGLAGPVQVNFTDNQPC